MSKTGITCYRDGGCGPYEMYSCYECPASKSDYVQFKTKPKPQTNYDYVISKTPEELTEWIESIEPAACPWRDDHGDNCRFTHCRDCWLDWLKSPVKMDGEE